MPDNSEWNELKKKFTVSFNNFNNFQKLLQKDDFDFHILIINFQNLINFPLDESDDEKKKLLFSKTNYLFKIIQNKLNLKKKIILIFDYYFPDHLIRSIKNNTLEDQLINYIQNFFFKTKLNKNFYYINLNNLFFKSKTNIKKLYDERMHYIANSRYSEKGLEIISNFINKTLERFYFSSKKVLILDCDNTIWGGVVGELGCQNIELGEEGIGKAYVDFQRAIKRLKHEGIILCISSKNNYNDVMNVFMNNRNMILKKQDFTSFKINWKNKSENIKEISSELDLGLDSFVFFDDNPIERDQVKRNCRQVTVINPDENVTSWASQMMECFELCKINITEEDKKKTFQYKNRVKFKEDLKNNYKNNSFLEKIRLEAKIVFFNQSNKQRALQLIQKTNQFNLTTRRYTDSQLEEFYNNKNNKIFLVDLKDKYGDHGTVALIMLIKKNNKLVIENFLISCRVLGRNLEDWIMQQIINYAKKISCSQIEGIYIKTEKNLQVLNFYPNFNFLKIKSGLYIQNLNNIIFKTDIKKIYKK